MGPMRFKEFPRRRKVHVLIRGQKRPKGIVFSQDYNHMTRTLDAGVRLFDSGKSFIDGRRIAIAAKKPNGRSHFFCREGAQDFFRCPFMGGIGAVQGLSIIENGFIEKFGFGTGRAFPVDSIIGMRAAAKAAKDGKNRNKDQRTCKNGLDAALGAMAFRSCS